MAHQYVRVCPVCGQDNPPEQSRCGCGALLSGIDFSLKRAPPDEVPGDAAARAATEAVPDDARAPVDSAVAGPVALDLGQDGVPGDRNADATPGPEAPVRAEPVADAADRPADPAASLHCPHADCGQANPPGRDRCIYCNRPLQATASAAVLAGARPLPSALRERYRVIDVFPATGSEADILLVADAQSGERCVAKLYRRGIAPDFRLLEVLARSVGDTVVRVLDHGTSDGTAFELLEYVPGGTLEDLMRAGPLPRTDITRIVREIADALIGIHAHRILHRDLKPENVLVRMKSPLELALTDFGIASFSAATQHFTSAARTTRYASPEVLTGVLDAKSDWWSLGMIVLEAASGRHPFDGLSEQVMNHHLATRPIDVRSVYDDALRTLCRGLLLRDPKRRWGADEVERWLAGDATLTVADDADGVATVVRPYRFDRTEATTAAELAMALAKHWDAARRDLGRGQIARWLERELHDYNLVRRLADLQERRDLSDDARLLRFLLAAAPDLPPVWCGAPLSEEALRASARAAADGDADAQDWLDSLYGDDALATYGEAGHDRFLVLDARWREDWRTFAQWWDAARRAEEKWRQRPRDVGGGADDKAVSFDDLAFGPTGRLVLPPQRAVNGMLLVAREDGAYLEALRGEVMAGLPQVAGRCAWFEALWDKAQHEIVGVVVARQMLAHARDDAQMETRRERAAAQARENERGATTDELRTSIAAVLAYTPEGDEALDGDHLTPLLEALDQFQQTAQDVLRLSGTGPEADTLRRVVEKLSSLGLAAQRALTEAEEVAGINAIFFAPQRLAVGVVVLAVVLLLRVPVALLLVAGGAVLALVYRWYASLRANEVAAAKLRLFMLHGRTFLRNGPGEPGSGGPKA